MHKGVILLVEAGDKDEAKDLVREFMEPYKHHAWDWYVIGGRWSNILIPQEKAKAYDKYAKGILKPLAPDSEFVTTAEVKSKMPLLQRKWKELGMSGNCPHTDNYELHEDGDAYDIVPLSDCLATVKDWVKDVPAEIEKTWESLVKAKSEGRSMVGYYAKELYDLDYGNFCFDSNVYNVTDEEAEAIPEDTTGYFAVMVDMHN